MKKFDEIAKSEIIERSLSASLAFIAIALIVSLTNLYAEELSWQIRVFGCAILMANAVRIFAYYRYQKTKLCTTKCWNVFFSGTTLNALLWGFCLSLILRESGNSHWTVTIALIIVMAFVNASVFTISNHALLHFYTIALMSLPTITTFFIRYKIYGDDFDLTAAALISIAAVYSFFQGKTYRRRSKEKHATDDYLQQSQAALLEQRAMTEHANRLTSMGELAADFGHEINNPLTIIDGNLKLLEMQLQKSGADENTLKLVTKALSASGRISKIIKGLRSLSHRSSAETLTPHKISAIINDTIALYEERLSRGGVDLKVSLSEDPVIVCDAIQISQIILNLLSNACDALIEVKSPDAWIKIQCRTLHENMAVIEVSNGGRPIENEVAEKLFAPFFTTKKEGLGLGLGLSISRSIALKHGGNLELDTQHGVTLFRLSLPLAGPAQTASA